MLNYGTINSLRHVAAVNALKTKYRLRTSSFDLSETAEQKRRYGALVFDADVTKGRTERGICASGI